MGDLEHSLKTTDEAFRAYKERHPDATYSSWYTTNTAEKLRKGHQHNSLGNNIVKGDISTFWETGRRQSERLMKAGAVASSQRVVEYGCGSLRVGGHFIDFLEPGHYFGLDIIADFFELGLKNVGQELIDKKRPRLAAISEQSVAEAAAFQPDFVYSFAVLIHVHPNDVPLYFRNLAAITSAKPGAKLVFNAMLYETPVRYNNLGWAWPEQFIRDQLPGLECVKMDRSPKPTEKGGYALNAAMFTFANPSR